MKSKYDEMDYMEARDRICADLMSKRFRQLTEETSRNMAHALYFMVTAAVISIIAMIITLCK